jgi:predicted ATP-grasp superfamily ATP-dependent carboligase
MAESAAVAGYAVCSLDAFGDLDQHPAVRAVSLPRDVGVPFTVDAVVRAAERIEIDVVAYLSPFENHPVAVERLARGRTLWGNGASVLRRVRRPGVVPRPAGVSSPDRWLVKPRASGGGHGIEWWSPGNPVPAGSHVEPFIDGEPGSIVFVAAERAIVPLGLTRQLVGDSAFGATGFRYCGSILHGIPSEARDRLGVIPSAARDRDPPDRGLSQLLDSALHVARGVVTEFDLVGVNCIDFIARDGIAMPIEINPRWSASMELVERAHGVSVFGVHAAACAASELPTFDLTRADTDTAVTGKAIVFARHDVVCGDTAAWLGDTTVRDVPHPGEHIPAGRPVCTVFASSRDADACHAALIARANRLYETLESWASVPA